MKAGTEDPGSWERIEKFLENETVRQIGLLAMLSCGLTLLVITGFLGSYRLHNFPFAMELFLLSLVMMILASIAHIVYSITAMVGKFKEGKKTLTISTVFSVLNVLILISALSVSIVTSSEMDNSINKINVEKSLRKALEDVSLMDQWDRLQSSFSCCGGRGPAGYQDWAKVMEGGVPDSCCTVHFPGCGDRQNIRWDELKSLKRNILSVEINFKALI